MKKNLIAFVTLVAIGFTYIDFYMDHDIPEDNSSINLDPIPLQNVQEQSGVDRKEDTIPLKQTQFKPEEDNSLFLKALALLEQAKSGDANAQIQLSSILRTCYGFVVNNNREAIEDDANYYLATANDSEKKYFQQLKNTIDSCSGFNDQNIKDFNSEDPKVDAADYWLELATQQNHPGAINQNLVYHPERLRNNDNALALLDRKLEKLDADTMFDLGVCLAVKDSVNEAGPLLTKACEKGMDCSIQNFKPVLLPLLVDCSSYSRAEIVATDGTVINMKKECYVQTNLNYVGESFFSSDSAEVKSRKKQSIDQALSSINGRQQLLKQCVGR